MSIDDLISSFNKIKDLAYNQTFQRLGLSDLAALIAKPNKNKEDINFLKNIYLYIKNIRESTSNLGLKILEMNTDYSVGENIIEVDRENLEAHTRDIITFLDQFIDSISALNRTYKFEESRVELKIMEVNIKTHRDAILRKAKDFRREKSLSIKIDEEIEDLKKEYKAFLNDIIDVVIKDAMKLNIIKVYSLLEKIFEKEGLDNR